MAEGRTRRRVEETAPPARRREPDPGDVARALFAEHLDLAAIRRALGQRTAPEEEETAAPTTAGNPAPDEAPLGRDLPRAERTGDTASVPGKAPAPARSPTAAPRRVSVRAAAALGGLIAATVMLGAWAFGPPSRQADALASASPPSPPARPGPLASVAPGPTGPAPAAPLAAVASENVAELPTAVPVVHRPAAVEPLARPGAPAGLSADILPEPPLPFVVASAGNLEPVARRRSVPSLRPASPIDARTPPAPVERVGAAPATRAGVLPVLARAAIDESPAAAGTALPNVAAPARRPAAASPAAAPAEAARGTSRVVVHAHGAGDPAFRAEITDSLRRAGFDRVEWRAVARTVGRTQTRFFHAGDRPWSDRAAGALAARGRAASTHDFTHYAPPPRRGTIEVWLSD